MCAPDIIMDVSDRSIERPILVVTGSNWDRRLVAAKYNGDKHRAMRHWILQNNILSVPLVVEIESY